MIRKFVKSFLDNFVKAYNKPVKGSEEVACLKIELEIQKQRTRDVLEISSEAITKVERLREELQQLKESR